ncbi:MAG: hypothetical protein JSS82_10370 [Bacteroidetes bacterium]|nr:hypothetical protein [Bacteroidota bacterium]
MTYLRTVVLPLTAVLLFATCKPRPKPAPAINAGEKGTYFSIKQYIKDQWNTYLGQPFGIIKVTTRQGKADSLLKNAYNLEWGDILNKFCATDIGNPEYLGHYRFDMFLDESTDTRNFYYEAIDDTLFTRKLQISAMQENNKIRSIYIETERKTGTKDIVQKLYYSPLRVIQIQEFDALATGDKNASRVEYFFL